MFKALKNNKIVCIGNSEEEDFRGLMCDEIIEDTEHSVSDYMQINGEFVLTSSAEAIEQKQAEARAERDRRIEAIRWRIERYQTQAAAGLETTDTAEHYKAILLYVQALRDVPAQAGFPDAIEWPEEP